MDIEKIGKKDCIRGNSNTLILGSIKYSVLDVINEIKKIVDSGKPNDMYLYSS